ncbi:MAG: hypothetical protein GAK35_02392 [Herbaspirillum frisingense]|uniref:Uncharacterized protein n=1 Tax=Herbaspirillum frisingense TaxID=92645 RepID=A0A7V8JTW5_9BURK|nr:MAG: hypothetical protein GAK35_02392 [Herbaspirillum frisingense]
MERGHQARGPDRRVSTEDLHRSIEGLARRLDARHQENVQHLDTNTAQLKEIKEQLEQLREGFPDNDPDGHRRYHEALIRAAEERRKFWGEWRAHIMKMGSVAVLGFLVVQAWEYFKVIVGKIPKG